MGRRPRIALRAEAPKAHINPHSTLWHNVYPPEYLESKDFSPGFGIVAETFLHCEGHRLFLSHLFRREEQSQTNNNNNNQNNTTTKQTTTKTTNKHKTVKTTQKHNKQQTKQKQSQGHRSAYAKAYLSCLEWEISAQLFPSHWEFDSCAFGEWWCRELYLSKCYCTFGDLTSIKVVVCKDFAM